VRVFSDLSLHDRVPVRAQPAIGEWGPVRVPTTRRKRLARIGWPIAFVLVLAALFTVGYFGFDQIRTAVGL